MNYLGPEECPLCRSFACKCWQRGAPEQLIEALKPCPFCGGVPERINLSDVRTYCEPGCPCERQEFDAETWNTRVAKLSQEVNNGLG